jgi:hypothetical protein
VCFDLLERVESEPLVESASVPVDMEHAKSKRLTRRGSFVHQPANERRADSPSLRCRQQLDLGEADGPVFLVDDKQPDVLILLLDDVPALRGQAASRNPRLLFVVPAPDPFDVLAHGRLVEGEQKLVILRSSRAQTPRGRRAPSTTREG